MIQKILHIDDKKCIINMTIKKDLKITSYNEDDISKILTIIKDCVRYDRFSISLNSNRKENEELRNEYNLTHAKYRRILLQLTYKDFCYGSIDIKDRKTVLYVFAPNAMLYDTDDIKIQLKLYIKIKILEKYKPKYLIVISFHRLNRQIEYLFR